MKKLPLALAVGTAIGIGAAEISALSAQYRNGQVFLQWQEKNLPAAARISVWSSGKPIDPSFARKNKPAAALLNVNSSTDWWQNPNCFVLPRGKAQKSEEIFAGAVADENAKVKKLPGFVITDGGRPIAPGNGLHVHTVKKSGSFYYAVGWQLPGDKELRQLIALKTPLKVTKAPISPIAITKAPKAGSGQKRPLVLLLHGRGGGVGVDSRGRAVGNFIFFADDTLAWREGIPFKFTVQVLSGCVRLILNDRTWIGRPLSKKESPDSRDYVPAVSSFWLAYNKNIGVSNLGPKFEVDNYSERLIVYLTRWAQRYFDCDPAATYISGGSMGGTGAVHLALHYPNVFAAVRAYVPVYSYTWKRTPGPKSPGVSATRLVCSCGFFSAKNPARMPDGTDLLEYASGEKQIAKATGDTPPIFATNGRQDMSIPWVNNPGFYRAANKAKQAFCVFWNNGNHGMSGALPADMKYTDKKLFQYRLDRSFPAFSNCSADKNYGKGDPAEGDIEGWINRGFAWKGVCDSKERFVMELSLHYPHIQYPVTADVTFRRLQDFKVKPGEKLNLKINGKSRKYTVPADGLLTVSKVTFADKHIVTIEISR